MARANARPGESFQPALTIPGATLIAPLGEYPVAASLRCT
jgi:hypothetical protein